MRIRPLSLFLSALAIWACVLPSQPSYALTFDFSFSNNISVGNIAGTVTGEIDGLVNNESGQSATAVYIDSYTSLLSGIPASNVNLLSVWAVQDNAFTVSAGNIVSENLYLTGSFVETLEFLAINNVQTALQDGTKDSSGSPASGVVFTLVGGAAPIPEPMSFSLLGIALLSFSTVRFFVSVSGYGKRKSEFLYQRPLIMTVVKASLLQYFRVHSYPFPAYFL